MASYTNWKKEGKRQKGIKVLQLTPTLYRPPYKGNDSSFMMMTKRANRKGQSVGGGKEKYSRGKNDDEQGRRPHESLTNVVSRNEGVIAL